MSDFDPCECVFGHEMEMRRLLSLLRQSQSHCTDTECFTSPLNEEQPMASDYYIIMSMMILVYFVMRYWMQNRQNRNGGDNMKPNNGNGLPPTPPQPPTSF